MYDAKSTQESLSSKIFIVLSLLRVCTFVCAYVCVALCLGSREAQLPQLSTLALALKSDGPLLPGCPWTPCSPAHCSLGPRTLQMIYYSHREREHSAPTSPHLPLNPSPLHLSSLPQPWMPVPLLSHSVSLKKRNLLPEFSPTCSFYCGRFIRIFPSYLCCLSLFCQLQLENTRIVFS